jgi:cation transport ATPase
MSSQLKHLIWYFRKNLKGEMEISRRNSFSKLFSPLSSGEGLLLRVGLVLFRIIALNSYTSVLTKMPVLLVAIALYWASLWNGANHSEAHIVAPVIAAVIIFFLINLPPLLFLGEAERYLNHVAFFVVAMATTLVLDADLSWIIFAVLGYGCVFWFVESFFLHSL